MNAQQNSIQIKKNLTSIYFIRIFSFDKKLYKLNNNNNNNKYIYTNKLWKLNKETVSIRLILKIMKDYF